MPKEVYNPKAVIPHAASLHQACAHCAISPTAASRRSLGRISVPVWPVTLSGRLPVDALVGHHPTNQLIGREPIPHQQHSFPTQPCDQTGLSGIRPRFQSLSRRRGQVTHVLLTRSPLIHTTPKDSASSFDLHVLSTPPAFVLSQDQTLHTKPCRKPKTSSQKNNPPHTQQDRQTKNSSHSALSSNQPPHPQATQPTPHTAGHARQPGPPPNTSTTPARQRIKTLHPTPTPPQPPPT